jgi:hypothetical protein
VHAVGAAGDVSRWEECGVGLVEPCGEADAAGDAVDFGEAEAVVGEEEVRADDGGELLTEGGETSGFEELGRFTGIGEGGDPWGETAGAAAVVETVAGGQEALEPMLSAREAGMGNGSGEESQSLAAKRPPWGLAASRAAGEMGIWGRIRTD